MVVSRALGAEVEVVLVQGGVAGEAMVLMIKVLYLLILTLHLEWFHSIIIYLALKE